MQSSGMTSPDSDRARDVDSECILNDDEIATIDGSRHDVAAAGQSPTMPTPPQAQVHCSFFLYAAFHLYHYEAAL